jgi:hypothetical protein
MGGGWPEESVLKQGSELNQDLQALEFGLRERPSDLVA